MDRSRKALLLPQAALLVVGALILTAVCGETDLTVLRITLEYCLLHQKDCKSGCGEAVCSCLLFL